jgi:hypothetical protein
VKTTHGERKKKKRRRVFNNTQNEVHGDAAGRDLTVAKAAAAAFAAVVAAIAAVAAAVAAAAALEFPCGAICSVKRADLAWVRS